MLERWSESLDLPHGFSFRGLMSTESQLLVWKGEGLPADDLSQVREKHDRLREGSLAFHVVYA